MLAAQPGSQTFLMDSKSPPGLVKLGLPESSQPVHLQSSTHGVVVGWVVTVVGVTGVAVDVVVVVVTVVVTIVVGSGVVLTVVGVGVEAGVGH